MKRTAERATSTPERVYRRDALAPRTAGRPRASEPSELAEFPEGAGDPPQGLPRREMLKLVGASLSLAGFAACRRPVEHIVPYVDAPEEVIPGIPRRFATAMPWGLTAYGLVVESHEGRPTKIEGNRLHPANEGTSSVRMQAALLDLYDPDRSRSVLRDGEPAAWPDFVAFWQETSARLAEGNGAGLALLSRPFASPTLARLWAAVGERYPAARRAVWEPVHDEHVHRGMELATGRRLRPRYRLEAASTIVALDADFLHNDPEAAAYARAFASRRRVTSPGDGMNRLYAAESGYSLTGAMADHRWRVRSGDVPALAAALAFAMESAGVHVDAVETAAPDGVDERTLRVVAHELATRRGRCLIVAGPGQPPEVHAAVFRLNHALGNVGKTVEYHGFDDAAPSRTEDLRALTSAMQAGEVDTLLVLGGNPAYDAPTDLAFAEALAKVPHAIHLASHADETSRLCRWHVPRAHFLEAWGDTRALSGAAAVTQPLVRPLLGGRSDVELLALVATGEERSGHDEVRETWAAILGGGDGFDGRFSRVLHDGVSEAGARAPVTPPAPGRAMAGLGRLPASPAGPENLELVFRPSPAVHDGGLANNGWLQELPDVTSKLAWGNAALLSPRTIEALGLRNGDVARLELDGRAIESPVWALPGMADWSVSLTLGYGREAAGRVGSGVGVDVYPLRASGAQAIVHGLQVTAAGRREELVSTQDHGTMQGEFDPEPRPIVREATLAHYREHPEFAKEMVEMPPLRQPFGEHDYSEGPQWGMSIDLNVCTGCNACAVACQAENNVPVVGPQQVRAGREMHWLRIDRYFASPAGRAEQDPSPEMVFMPVPCMHCENAPCEQVCPVAATVHDGEGLNVMVYNRCIGTRYCANNCPYKVRRFNFFHFTKDIPEIARLAHNPDVTVRSRGVMEKCSFCTQRINAARIDARIAGRELRDGDVTTACEQACPTGAIVFGDVRDPESRVSRQKAQDRDYTLLAELNNRPRTTFLAKLRNPHPELAEPEPETDASHHG